MIPKKPAKTGTTRKREVIIFGVCFLAATILMLIGIIMDRSPAKELIMKLHVTLIVALVFYGVVMVFRVLYHLISNFWIRK